MRHDGNGRGEPADPYINAAFELLLGFYSPITRAWKFGAGAILALHHERLKLASARSSAVVSLVGVLLLGISLWQIRSASAFPGVATMAPVVGTVLLLIGGTQNSNPSPGCCPRRRWSRLVTGRTPFISGTGP